MTDLSILIPSRNEKYLVQTVTNILENIQADTEIVVVLDGCWWEGRFEDNPRVVIIHHTEARGQRQSINEAARIAKGKYLMKLDAHCAVGPGFDRILIDDYQEGWTVVPRMYNLDVETWKPKLNKRTDYMYIGMHTGHELRPEYYEYKDYKGEEYRHLRQPDNDKLIDETMCCMGPGWFLSAETFWKTGGCDEGHGSWGQQSVEVSLKAWLSGGALMVNKKTWFAHWFRGSEGFPYPLTGHEVDTARKYSLDIWLNNKWPGQVRDLKWLVDKFNPPGWENMIDETKRMEMNSYTYRHIHLKNKDIRYRGIQTMKMPSDMQLYHEVIWENRPQVIVEIGTAFGGSSLYFQDQLDLLGDGGQVITIDVQDRVAVHDPRITYLMGDAKKDDMVAQIKELTDGKTVMVVVDGDHRRVQVKWELKKYSQIVTPGQYLVVEDCFAREGTLYQPGEARDWFLSVDRNFVQTNLDHKYLVGMCIGGWLRRK